MADAGRGAALLVISLLALMLPIDVARAQHDAGGEPLAALSSSDVRMLILYQTADGDTIAVRPRPRTPHDPWLSFDKIQHFTFSFLFTLGGQYTFENKFDIGQAHALPLSVTGSFLVGLGKELHDLHRGPRRYFSYRDMVANGAGIVVAIGFILL